MHSNIIFIQYYKGELALIITIVCDVLGKENNGTTVAAVNLIRALKRDRKSVV